MTQLQLSAAFEYPKLASTKEQKTILMATVQAPKHENDESKSRTSCDIIAVMDRSGSMGGDKIELVKKTLEFMIEQLKEEDNMCLITFDTQVSIDIPLSKMSSQGKDSAKTVIRALYAGDSTNLSGGLFQGLEVIKARKSPNKVVSILLFTDGLANVGVTQSSLIVDGLEKGLQQLGCACSIFTFGFGKDHDANMLTQIANAGNGLYYYLQQEDEIPDSFANCLGGLLTVVAQNCKLTVEASLPGVKVLKTLSQYRHADGEEKDKRVCLSLGDMYSEEKRDVLFEVSLPALDTPLESYEPVKISVDYFNVVTVGLQQQSIMASAKRPQIVADSDSSNQSHVEIDKQKVRSRSVQALAQARELANKGNIPEARKILQDAMAENEKANAANQTFAQAMNHDLQQCLDNMRDQRSYASTGSKLLNMNWSANNAQRHVSNFSAVQKMSYQTPMQANYEMQAQAIKPQPHAPKAAPPAAPSHLATPSQFYRNVNMANRNVLPPPQPVLMSQQPVNPFSQQQPNPFGGFGNVIPQQQLPSQVPQQMFVPQQPPNPFSNQQQQQQQPNPFGGFGNAIPQQQLPPQAPPKSQDPFEQ